MTPVRRCAWITVLVIASAQVPFAQTPRRYSLGVVRADGALIPFAQFDGGQWRVIWSATDRNATPSIPLTLPDVDEKWWGRGGPALEWQLLSQPGAAARAFRATAPRSVFLACGAFPALATDLPVPPGAPPPFQSPYPKAGIATTAPVTFEPIERLAEKDVEWRRVALAVDKVFPGREIRALSDMAWAHPWSDKERNARPIDVQAIWHARDSRFYYVEAIRRYAEKNPPKGQAPCELVSYLSGWFWDAPNEEIRQANADMLVSYCHMERASFLWPFGVIREGDKRYWVVQRSGWTGEVYAVMEPNRSNGGVRTSAWVGYGACYR